MATLYSQLYRGSMFRVKRGYKPLSHKLMYGPYFLSLPLEAGCDV